MKSTLSRLKPLCGECEEWAEWTCCQDNRRREYVYFAHIGPYVKVGFSTQPDTRLDQLTGASWGATPAHPRFHPNSCEMFYPVREPRHAFHVVEVRDGRSGERDAHRALEDFRDVGEWFIAEPPLLAWAADRQAGEGFPHLPREGGEWERPRNAVELAEFEHVRNLTHTMLDACFGRST